MSKRMSKERFDLFAIGTRQPPIYHIADELSYWSDVDENVIGVVFRDRIDNDFGWALLVRDRLGRFRAAELNHSLRSERWAQAALRVKIADVSRTADLAEFGIQGDEFNAAIDLLTVLPGTRSDQLHPNFGALMPSPCLSASA